MTQPYFQAFVVHPAPGRSHLPVADEPVAAPGSTKSIAQPELVLRVAGPRREARLAPSTPNARDTVAEQGDLLR